MQIVITIILAVIGPVLQFIAPKAPKQVLDVVIQLKPVIDEIQRQADVEAARRLTQAAEANKDQAVS